MPTSILLDLTRRYLEPHRRYHTLSHIAAMLQSAQQAALSEGRTLADEQVFAIWFHDAIYDTGAKDNEEKSADLAEEMLSKAGWPGDFVERVRLIVLDTKHHQPCLDLSKAVIDADLQTLAAPWPEYLKIGEMIRHEYAAVSDAQWKEGRAGFFQSWLKRDQIFYTPWGAKLEKQARENLARTVAGEVR